MDCVVDRIGNRWLSIAAAHYQALLVAKLALTEMKHRSPKRSIHQIL
jgi:hypothetical protein